MKQNQMFSSRDTLEEAHAYAESIISSLPQGLHAHAYTAIWVILNTAIKLLEEKEAARKVKISFQIQPTEEPLPPGTYHAKLVEGTEPLDPRLHRLPLSDAVRLRSQIDALTRKVTDLHDLRFARFTLEHILRSKK